MSTQAYGEGETPFGEWMSLGIDMYRKPNLAG
jgi:hypothetical protein